MLCLLPPIGLLVAAVLRATILAAAVFVFAFAAAARVLVSEGIRNGAEVYAATATLLIVFLITPELESQWSQSWQEFKTQQHPSCITRHNIKRLSIVRTRHLTRRLARQWPRTRIPHRPKARRLALPPQQRSAETHAAFPR